MAMIVKMITGAKNEFNEHLAAYTDKGWVVQHFSTVEHAPPKQWSEIHYSAIMVKE